MKKRVFSILLALALIISTLCTMPAKAAEVTDISDYYNLVAELVDGSNSLPAKFDLRDYGLVTPARNQGKTNTCYVHATLAALESNALIKGYGQYNLSERYLAWCSKHIINTSNKMINDEGVVTSETRDWYMGGYLGWSTHALMNGYGINLETTYPLNNISDPIYSVDIHSEPMRCSDVFSISVADRTAVKQAIVNHGAVEFTFYWTNDNKVFKNTRNSKTFYMSEDYCNHNKGIGSHAVAIIGWDDNYSKSNFATTPPGDGAWILKDSGNGNYIYLSYYTCICKEFPNVRAYEVAPIETYDSLYTYDGGVGLTEVKTTNDIAISFKANSDETLTGVAVKLEGKTTATIKVYKNIGSVTNVTESNCIYTQSVNLTESGYQTLEFTKGVNISASDNIFVTVHFSNPVVYFIDNRWSSGTVTSIASANPNETFIKKDNGNWEDLVNYNKASACIKVLSRNGHNRKPLTLGNSNLTVNNTKEATIDLTWKEVEGAESYEIYRKAEGEWKYTLLKTVSNTTLKYSDTKLTLGKKYTYKVIPVAGNVEGFSAEKTLTATIAATWIKKLDNSKSGKITITINKTKTAKSYSVYRYNGKEYKWIGNTTTGTFVDKTVKSGTIYTYKVKANKGSLSSAYSAAKSSKAK